VARVTFAHTGLTVDAPSGERLVDVADALPGAGLPSACRHANCGLCRVWVLEGAELLAPPEAPERVLLSRLAAPAGVRLGCQVRLREGDGLLRVWPVEAPGGPQGASKGS
jgi:ferredoxin